MTIERDRLLELARARLESERQRIESELEQIRAELSGSQRSAGKAGKGQPKKRGRRSMTPAQKKAVSVRMKKYWAERRKREREAKKSN